MNIKHLLDIIAHGEGLHTEFKEAGVIYPIIFLTRSVPFSIRMAG